MSEQKPIVVNPTELAALLGVPRWRLHFEVKNTPVDGKTMVSVEMLIDGKDLTPEQTDVATEWLQQQIKAKFSVASKS